MNNELMVKAGDGKFYPVDGRKVEMTIYYCGVEGQRFPSIAHRIETIYNLLMAGF